MGLLAWAAHNYPRGYGGTWDSARSLPYMS